MVTTLPAFSGTTAVDIAEDIRTHIERGTVPTGATLPPVRTLADLLGVNRNTVVAAYRQLASAGLVESKGRSGTRVIAQSQPPREGFAPDTVLRDVGSGNPDPRLIPSPERALAAAAGRPVLYGEPVVDADLALWAGEWFARDYNRTDLHLTITSGAVDAVERLLQQALVRDDAIALEDPCFLASIHTVRLGGYRAIAVPVDEEGMTVAGLRSALEAGVRAVVLTPRAQNPTGASLSAERAAALRGVLTDYPYVLVIEDDHFSLLATTPHQSIIGEGHKRFAVVRSVSKFLGPDMSLALVASDQTTAQRLGLRLSPGTTWVSHLLQRLAVGLLTDPDTMQQIREAGAYYAERNAYAADALRARGISVAHSDGLNLWVTLPLAAAVVEERLMRRGWLVRTGQGFELEAGEVSHHLRLTLHDLGDTDLRVFAGDLAAAIAQG